MSCPSIRQKAIDEPNWITAAIYTTIIPNETQNGTHLATILPCLRKQFPCLHTQKKKKKVNLFDTKTTQAKPSQARAHTRKMVSSRDASGGGVYNVKDSGLVYDQGQSGGGGNLQPVSPEEFLQEFK